LRIKITDEFLTALTSNRIYLRPHFHHGDSEGKIVNVINSVNAEAYARIPESSFSWDGSVFIGAFSYIVQGSILGQSSIGRYCSIGTGVRIMGQSHPTDRVTTSTWTYGSNVKRLVENDFGVTPLQSYDVPNEPGVRIGNDVWIADNVTFKRNITVHDGAIIAANAVVTKDVPHYAIVAGNPAKVVKYRFPEQIIAALREVKWWEKSPRLLSKFDLSNVESFLEHSDEMKSAENFEFENINLTELIKKLSTNE